MDAVISWVIWDKRNKSIVYISAQNVCALSLRMHVKNCKNYNPFRGYYEWSKTNTCGKTHETLSFYERQPVTVSLSSSLTQTIELFPSVITSHSTHMNYANHVLRVRRVIFSINAKKDVGNKRKCIALDVRRENQFTHLIGK